MTRSTSPADLTASRRQASASLDGSCTAMILFTREIGPPSFRSRTARMLVPYVGSRRGPAQLLGEAHGQRPRPDARMAGPPRIASMTLSSPSEGRMVLTTMENHPDTGEPGRHCKKKKKKSRNCRSSRASGLFFALRARLAAEGVAGLKRGRSPELLANAVECALSKQPACEPGYPRDRAGRPCRRRRDRRRRSRAAGTGSRPSPASNRFKARSEDPVHEPGWRHPAGGSLF